MATRKTNKGVAPVATPLTLNIDPDTLTLDDIEVFEPGGFTVRGFTADAAGSTAARAHAKGLEAARLSTELARRFAESGFGAPP